MSDMALNSIQQRYGTALDGAMNALIPVEGQYAMIDQPGTP